MASKFLNVFNGVNYEQIEIEEILNERGEATGHYKQRGKEDQSVYGVLDDKELYEETCRTIEEMITYDSYFYGLTDNQGYIKIFCTLNLYAIPNSVESVSKGVMDELAAAGYVTAIDYGNNEIFFTVSDRTTAEKSIYIFKSFKDYVIKVDN